MKSARLVLVALGALLMLLVALPAASGDTGSSSSSGEVVVANRASGTVSVIDAGSDEVIGTYPLPMGDNPPQPMYVSYVKSGHRLFVGDRANNRVVVLNADDYSTIATVPAGNGVFHQWADPRDRQRWVNNDIDGTATVIDPWSLTVLGTGERPADLIAVGYTPPEAVLDPKGRFAYVTLVGGIDNDWLVQFDTATLTEVNRAPVGLDPHVSLSQRNMLIYVPAQNSDLLTVLDRRTLDVVAEVVLYLRVTAAYKIPSCILNG